MSQLPHVYAYTDNHVTTTSTAFQDALTIEADKFVADHIYICHVVADIGGSNRNGNVRIRVTHGGTLITGSEGRREPDSGSVTRFHHYRFLCKHSPGGSPGDVVVDYCRASTSSMSASIANIQALFLDVTNLGEDADYYYNENTTTDLLSTTLSDHANLAIAAANGDEWLVIGSAQVDIAATSVGYNVRLSCDDLTGDDADLPHYRVEAEDTGDFDCCGLERVYELDAGTHNVAVKMSAVHSSNPASHDHSAIFAINLKLFESYTLSSPTLFSPDRNGFIPGDDGDAAFAESAAEMSIAALPAWKPDTTSSVWIIGGFTISDADRDRVHYRLRYNENDTDTLPPNATSNSYGHESYFSSSSDPDANRDRLSCYRSVILTGVSSDEGSEEVYKFEADSAQGSDTENDYFDSHLYVISLWLAAAGGETQDLEADIAAVSTVTASLSKIAALDADIAAASTVTASLSKIAALDADIAAVSTVTASFEKLASLLDADIAAASTVTASLERIRPLDAGIAAASTVTASLSKTAALDAGIAAASTVTASLERVRPLDAGIAAASTVTASLERVRPLDAGIAATSTVTASLERIRALDAGIAAASTVTVSLKGIRALDADITAASTVTVSLERIRPLDADIAATSSVVVDFGVSEAIQSLSAGIAAASTVSASMQKTAALSASINAVSTVQGSFALPGVFVDGLENDFEVPSGGRDFTIASGGRDVSVPAGGRNFTIGSV